MYGYVVQTRSQSELLQVDLYMLVPICRPDPICKLGVPVCKLGVFENAGKACVLETVP